MILTLLVFISSVILLLAIISGHYSFFILQRHQTLSHLKANTLTASQDWGGFPKRVVWLEAGCSLTLRYRARYHHHLNQPPPVMLVPFSLFYVLHSTFYQEVYYFPVCFFVYYLSFPTMLPRHESSFCQDVAACHRVGPQEIFIEQMSGFAFVFCFVFLDQGHGRQNFSVSRFETRFNFVFFIACWLAKDSNM